MTSLFYITFQGRSGQLVDIAGHETLAKPGATAVFDHVSLTWALEHPPKQGFLRSKGPKSLERDQADLVRS